MKKKCWRKLEKLKDRKSKEKRLALQVLHPFEKANDLKAAATWLKSDEYYKLKQECDATYDDYLSGKKLRAKSLLSLL